METFEEVETDGKITLILGGKVLVVGIGLAVDRRDGTRPNRPYQDLIRIARQRCDDGILGFDERVPDRSHPGVPRRDG